MGCYLWHRGQLAAKCFPGGAGLQFWRGGSHLPVTRRWQEDYKKHLERTQFNSSDGLEFAGKESRSKTVGLHERFQARKTILCLLCTFCITHW